MAENSVSVEARSLPASKQKKNLARSRAVDGADALDTNAAKARCPNGSADLAIVKNHVQSDNPFA